MHSLIDFALSIEASPRNRRLMARIALNAQGWSNKYPVDISELRDLSADQRALVRSYLSWTFEHPRWMREPQRFASLFAWADGRASPTALFTESTRRLAESSLQGRAPPPPDC